MHVQETEASQKQNDFLIWSGNPLAQDLKEALAT